MRKPTYRRYTFTTVRHATRNTHEVEITDHNLDRRSVEVTDATYNRFANLANSGQYDSGILSADHGIAWQIVRWDN